MMATDRVTGDSQIFRVYIEADEGCDEVRTFLGCER